jgi:serine phosphatase RsbU (regulator of sigma subunit)/DNA-binding NarL/FixJ family response regulator
MMNDLASLVLLVEASDVRAEQVRDALKGGTSSAFEIQHVSGLGQACQRLAFQRFDVILLGLSIPDGEALEAFQTLRDSSPDIPVVLLTERHDETLALRIVRAGAEDIVFYENETSSAFRHAIDHVIQRARGLRYQQDRERFLSLLTGQMPCVCWTTDRQLHILSLHGGASLGIASAEEELLGHDVSVLFPEDARAVPFREAHRQAIGGSSASLDLERQGRMHHVHVEPFRDHESRLIGAVGLAMDVTDRRLIDLELRLTRQIQVGLLPSSPPSIPGYDIAGVSESVAEAGGDYFDYFPVSDQTTGIVVCDVGGHGLGPALVMSHTRAYLRALALTHSDPGEILTLVNRFLCEDIDEERLVTLFFAKLDAASRTIWYANAGHQGYRLTVDGRAELLAPSGLPLNVLAETNATTAEPVPLQSGELIVLYTDGIVENPTADGGQFGTQQMLDWIRSRREQPAAGIVQGLLKAVRSQSPQPRIYDDMTLVVIKVE